MHVKRNQVALANTHETAEQLEPRGMKRVEFATTEPLPSSLVAFAVGPFDIVQAGRAGSAASRSASSRRAAALRKLTSPAARRPCFSNGWKVYRHPYPFDKPITWR